MLIESIGLQAFWLAILSLAVATVAWTVTPEEVFREPREYAAMRSEEADSLSVASQICDASAGPSLRAAAASVVHGPALAGLGGPPGLASMGPYGHVPRARRPAMVYCRRQIARSRPRKCGHVS